MSFLVFPISYLYQNDKKNKVNFLTYQLGFYYNRIKLAKCKPESIIILSNSKTN